MGNNTGLVVIFCLSAAFIAGCGALRCYECDSFVTPECTNSSRLPRDSTVFCGDLNSSSTVCVHAVFKSSNKKEYTWRACNYFGTQTCDKVKGTLTGFLPGEMTLASCITCTTDGCSSAPRVELSAAILVLLISLLTLRCLAAL